MIPWLVSAVCCYLVVRSSELRLLVLSFPTLGFCCWTKLPLLLTLRAKVLCKMLWTRPREAGLLSPLLIGYRKRSLLLIRIILIYVFSTIRDADRIYVMGGGEVLEQGSHNDLLANENGPVSYFFLPFMPHIPADAYFAIVRTTCQQSKTCSRSCC